MLLASVCLTLSRKLSKTVELDLARALHGSVDSTIAYIFVWCGVPATPATPSWQPTLVHEAGVCRWLGVCASPPLALPVANGQPDISSQRSFKEISVQESGKRVTATRVSDFAVWDDLIVPPLAESQPGRR